MLKTWGTLSAGKKRPGNAPKLPRNPEFAELPRTPEFAELPRAPEFAELSRVVPFLAPPGIVWVQTAAPANSSNGD